MDLNEETSELIQVSAPTQPKNEPRRMASPVTYRRGLHLLLSPCTQVCPAGYNCGSGTDRSTQFAHKCPAGLFCSAGTEPHDQFESVCDAGYYCIRGTPNYLATQVFDGRASGGNFHIIFHTHVMLLSGIEDTLGAWSDLDTHTICIIVAPSEQVPRWVILPRWHSIGSIIRRAVP